MPCKLKRIADAPNSTRMIEVPKFPSLLIVIFPFWITIPDFIAAKTAVTIKQIAATMHAKQLIISLIIQPPLNL